MFWMMVPETHTLWNWFLLYNIIQSDHFHSLCSVFCFEVDHTHTGSLFFCIFELTNKDLYIFLECVWRWFLFWWCCEYYK